MPPLREPGPVPGTGPFAAQVPGFRGAGIILTAGASRRLGRPKQVLPYGTGVLLDAVLATARDCGFAQTVLALGGAAAEVQQTVGTTGCDVVVNPDFGEGCSSSIATALAVLHPEIEAVVLMLGDQPGVRAGSVHALLRALAVRQPGRAGGTGIAVCRYEDGIGHPMAFTQGLLPQLAGLHGDKGVWKLVKQRAADVVEVAIPGPVPLDVDTEDDYRRVLAELQARA